MSTDAAACLGDRLLVDAPAEVDSQGQVSSTDRSAAWIGGGRRWRPGPRLGRARPMVPSRWGPDGHRRFASEGLSTTPI